MPPRADLTHRRSRAVPIRARGGLRAEQGGSGQGGASEAGTFDAGQPGGAVDLPGVYNARETGGLPTSDGKYVRRDVLIRSGHLAELDATGCQQLAQIGIRSVVDLRAASAASSLPDAECVLNTTAHYQAGLAEDPAAFRRLVHPDPRCNRAKARCDLRAPRGSRRHASRRPLRHRSRPSEPGDGHPPARAWCLAG